MTHELPKREDRELCTVREIGFDSALCVEHGSAEQLFFIGPAMADGQRERGTRAAPDTVREFIAYWERQIAIARDYLANGCNPRTDHWTVTTVGWKDEELPGGGHKIRPSIARAVAEAASASTG